MTNKELIKRIRSVITQQQLLAAQQKVVVGVSGGTDSLALLHLLREIDLQLSLTAVYVNHGLRPLEIPGEIALVEKQAAEIHAQFFSIAVDVKTYQRVNKTSPEEAARILRYDALKTIAQQIGATTIAIAHTANDQVEEFLLRMLRGSGGGGLSGMNMRRGSIVRPLLSTRKDELLNYLNNKGVSHCEDSSNKERIYLRNRVRLDLIPQLKEYNPSIDQTILNISDVLRVEDDYLNTIVDDFYQNVITTEEGEKSTISIDCAELSAVHKAIQRRVLEKVCWQMDCPPSFQNIESIYHMSQRGKNGKILQLANGLRVEKRNSCIFFNHPFGKIATRTKCIKTVHITRVIDGPGLYSFPEINRELLLEQREHSSGMVDSGKRVDSATFSFPLIVRSHRPGDRFFPLGAPGSKKVGRYLTDKKIHGGDKAYFPLLTEGTTNRKETTNTQEGKKEKIIAILGLTIDSAHQVTAETDGHLRILWRPLTETV